MGGFSIPKRGRREITDGPCIRYICTSRFFVEKTVGRSKGPFVQAANLFLIVPMGELPPCGRRKIASTSIEVRISARVSSAGRRLDRPFVGSMTSSCPISYGPIPAARSKAISYPVPGHPDLPVSPVRAAAPEARTQPVSLHRYSQGRAREEASIHPSGITVLPGQYPVNVHQPRHCQLRQGRGAPRDRHRLLLSRLISPFPPASAGPRQTSRDNRLPPNHVP